MFFDEDELILIHFYEVHSFYSWGSFQQMLRTVIACYLYYLGQCIHLEALQKKQMQDDQSGAMFTDILSELRLGNFVITEGHLWCTYSH